MTALAAGNIAAQADLFVLRLANGTSYRWTSWDRDLVNVGFTYKSLQPWLSRGQWAISNTMEIPTLEVFIQDNETTPFGTGTLPLKAQIINGLLDGALFFLLRAFLPSTQATDTSTYGTVSIFNGDVGAVSMVGAKVTLKIRGRNSRLSINCPSNVYQPGCIHDFCDPQCTLSAASFTNTYTVDTGSTRTFINIVLDPSLSPVQLVNGTITMTSGINSGLSKNIIDFQTSGGHLVSLDVGYPFPSAPAAGDTMTIFQGCDKTAATCLNVYNNLLNFRGFPYMPPSGTTTPG